VQGQENAPHWRIEFLNEGRLRMTSKRDGTEYKVEGMYALKGNKLTVTAVEIGKTTDRKTMTVKELTDRVLVFLDNERKMEFKRRNEVVKVDQHANLERLCTGPSSKYQALAAPAACGRLVTTLLRRHAITGYNRLRRLMSLGGPDNGGYSEPAPNPVRVVGHRILPDCAPAWTR
jgi:uncharacterized protein (TIGR03066 family)